MYFALKTDIIMILKNHATKFTLFVTKLKSVRSGIACFANRRPFKADPSYVHS
jgi:hypothetical protein